MITGVCVLFQKVIVLSDTYFESSDNILEI